MCAIIKNPLQRDGTSQQDRLLKALLPENAKIDDRKIEDILAFATAYSRQINFYDTENKPDGDWSCFYENDTCILLALLATIDTNTIEAVFKSWEEKINNYLTEGLCNDTDTDTDPLPGYYDEMINIIFSIALRIQQSCKRLQDGNLLKEEIITIIKNDLHLAIIDNKQQSALVKLIGYDKGSLAPLNDYAAFIKTPKNNFCICTKAWQLDAEGYDCIYPDNSFTVESLKKLFYIFFIALLKIKQRAKNYFETCLQTKEDHEPHVTLFLTFLYLFQYAIDHLNTLTSQHLLYYYHNVLCLHKQQQTPDKVHVIFELAKNFHTHLVEEGTLLNAGKDDTGKPLAFSLVEEVVVNRASVAEVKTVYINDTTGVVHAAENANTKDGIAEPFNKDEEPSWKSLGGTNSPVDEIGFAIASPMFFLKEGIRAGMISCKLKSDTTAAVMEKATGFKLLYSSEKDWVEVENIFDVLERILLKYPVLQKLYIEKKDAIHEFVVKGFEYLKVWYEKMYFVSGATVKSLSTDNQGFNADTFFELIQQADATTIANFLLSANGKISVAEKKIKNVKEADSTAIDINALKKEIMLVRNDILAINNSFICNTDKNRKEFDFFFIANFNAPAFSPLIPDEKNTGIISAWPIIKILIKNTKDEKNQPTCDYNDIKLLQVVGADIKVAAYGLKDIIVQNDVAILDNSKEIQPFTARPYKGSYFYLGSKEIFQKKLDIVGVQMEWADKPESFAVNYQNYISSSLHSTIQNLLKDNNQEKIKQFNESLFKVNAEILNGGIYQDIYSGSGQRLFNTAFQGKTIIALAGIKKVDDNDELPDIKPEFLKLKGKTKAVIDNTAYLSKLQKGFELRSFQRDPYINDFTDYNTKVQRGFMRLSLEPQDFLHREYSLSYTSIVVNKGAALLPAHLPQEPYTPKLKNTSLFYVSTERTQFGADNYNATIEEFYHITPFGYQKMEIDKKNEVFLLPQFCFAHEPSAAEQALINLGKQPLFTQGNLYIGLKDALPEQKVNILFQMLSGTGDNRFAPPDVEWSYLTGNTWLPFKPFEIQDHTRADESSNKSLLQSGIIEFSLPKAINSTGTTILNDDYFWIRAVAHEDVLNTTDSDAMIGLQRIAALPDLAAVLAQAGMAQFENNNNSLSHLAAPLPAKTISKFIDSRAAVKKVEQPYYSFYGKMPENHNEFYRRISERLRHKNRAICIWDYERMVLQQFPQLHKVKCLNHTGIAANLIEPTTGIYRLREITPGFVTVSVIPDLLNKNAVNKLEPRVPVGLLDEIKMYLKKHTNLFVTAAYSQQLDYLQVLNPLYEPVKVKTCVRFYEGFDVAYYKYLLNEDLKKFLSPWAFDANTEINFGAVYHRSAILNFIEERKYVDVVLGFEVMHYKDGVQQISPNEEWIVPTTSRSVLTSYSIIDLGAEYEHDIEYKLYNEAAPCPACSVTPVKVLPKMTVK